MVSQIEKMPDHFDERQIRIFEKYAGKVAYQKAYFDELDNDMWLAERGRRGNSICKVL